MPRPGCECLCSAGFSALPPNNAATVVPAQVVTRTTQTLDMVVADKKGLKSPFQFLKIDVQGAEKEVLQVRRPPFLRGSAGCWAYKSARCRERLRFLLVWRSSFSRRAYFSTTRARRLLESSLATSTASGELSDLS